MPASPSLHSPSIPPPPPPSQTRYTVFTSRQKRILVLLLSWANLASPLTATVYLPLLPLLETRFGVSLQAINLTITVPIILTTFSLYTVASIGLVFNRHSYAALLVLRALQSLGASAIQAVSYGVIADVCVPAERGRMQGPVISMSNLGVNLGPLLGGLLAFKSGNTEWAFWGLVAFGGVSFLVLGAFLKETARTIVGQGDQNQRAWWTQAWWDRLVSRFNTESEAKRNSGEKPASTQITGSSNELHDHWASWKRILEKINVQGPIRIVFYKDTALILWMAASAYANYYCIQTSNPQIYKNMYHFNELKVGLSYLPGGAGVVFGAYANGRLMDRNYAATAKKIGHEVDRVAGDDLDEFPIERARVRSCWILLGISSGAWIGYGWALEKSAHVSAPLIFQFVHGVLCTCILQTFNALLVDVFPRSPSAAATSGNITRCALSALYVALLQPIVDVIGRGWCFTLLGVTSGLVGAPAVYLLQSYGPHWRSERRNHDSATV